MDLFLAREWSAPATGSADIGWDRRQKHLPRVPGVSGLHCPKQPLPRKPASLADLAASVAAANFQDIDPSHLRRLSPRALQLMLKHLDLKSVSLSSWKTLQELVRSGHLDINKTLVLYQFLHHVPKPTADLPVYLAPLQSPSLAFISHLRLAGPCLLKPEELLYLPQWSKNLGLLELMEPSDNEAPFPRLNDRIFKAWSLADDSFPRLKAIRLSTQNSITEQCLQYLTRFPVLIMLDITAGEQEWPHPESLANDLGWIYCNRAEADDDDDGEGHPNVKPEISVTSHKDWLRLSLGLDMLDIGPPPVIAWNGPGTTQSCGFKLHNLLSLPAPEMLRQGQLMRELPWSSSLASLTLGADRKHIRSHRCSSPEERMFFWRYWLDGVRHPVPRNKDKPASMKPLTSMKRPAKSGSATIRSSKKRSADAISDVLAQFE